MTDEMKIWARRDMEGRARLLLVSQLNRYWDMVKFEWADETASWTELRMATRLCYVLGLDADSMFSDMRQWLHMTAEDATAEIERFAFDGYKTDCDGIGGV